MFRNISGRTRNSCSFLSINSFKYQTNNFNAFNQCVKNRNVHHLIASPNICLHSKKLSIRYYSTNETNENDNRPKRSIPILTDAPIIITFPSFFRNIFNIIKTFQIRSGYEPTFDVKEFLKGVRVAVGVISSKLANGDIDGLHGLVTDELLRHLREVIRDIPSEELQELHVNECDIFNQFIRDISVIEQNERIFIEIFVVQYVNKDVSQLYEMKLKDIPKDKRWYMQEITRVLNYQFIKEVTKGVEDEWTVNLINHARLSDVIEQKRKEWENIFKLKK